MNCRRFLYPLIVVIITVFIPQMAIASPVTYQYVGNYFDTFGNNLGGHGDYDATNRVELNITTFDGPFVVGDNTANVASFTFYDGRHYILQGQNHTLRLDIFSFAGLVPDDWIIEAVSFIATLEHRIGSAFPIADLDYASIEDTTGKDMGYIRGNPGTWTTTEVPVPVSIWLFGTGLVGLVGLRRKFKK